MWAKSLRLITKDDHKIPAHRTRTDGTPDPLPSVRAPCAVLSRSPLAALSLSCTPALTRGAIHRAPPPPAHRALPTADRHAPITRRSSHSFSHAASRASSSPLSDAQRRNDAWAAMEGSDRTPVDVRIFARSHRPSDVPLCHCCMFRYTFHMQDMCPMI